MKIAIDLQALQTRNSRGRGIGRYTKSVLESLVSLQSDNHYHMFANGTLPEPELDRKICSYSTINYPQIGSCDINDLLMKTTILAADVEGVFVPSPMEGLDSTIPDYSYFSKKVFTICYDLIPLIFADRYLNDANMHSLYMKRLINVQNADLIFAISESTRQDCIKYLNIYPDKVINVSGGVSPFFTPVPTSEHQTWLKLFANKFKIDKKFVLYTGGEDWRKNIEGLVKAFAKLPKNLQESHQLVIACKVSEFFAQEITNLATKLKIERSLVLTNYVTDEELKALYSTCSLFVFPSFYEGFGLPLLEAIACGAPAIASNNSSLIEIVASTEQLFDAHSTEDIVMTMQTVLENENFQRQLSENALSQAKKFTWKSVAQKISDAFRDSQAINKVSITFNRVESENTNIKAAFFSPFKPIKSGIADYSQDLLPSLSQHLNLDLYYDKGYLPDADVWNKLFSFSEFENKIKEENYQAIIYQIGNSSYHCYMYSHLMKYPGISVLHDYCLGGLINYISVHRSELGITFKKELEHSYGIKKAEEILDLLAKGKLNFEGKLAEAQIYINRRIFTRSLGVVLHSDWAYKSAINNYSCDNEFITRIPEPVPIFTDKILDKKLIRNKLEIPTDSLVIASFGFLNSTKRPLEILRAFQTFSANNPDAYLIFVGGTEYLGNTDIQGEIIRLGLQNQVKVTGFIPMEDFYKYIDISDICINLRYPFNGESSASLLRILSAGKPTIVTNIGSFADFPDDVVLKIPQPIEANEVDEIFKALTVLKDNEEYKNSLGRNANAYIAKEHSLERCARLYVDFIREVLKSPHSKRKMLADYVGREAAKLDLKNPNSLLAEFAQVIESNHI